MLVLLIRCDYGGVTVYNCLLHFFLFFFSLTHFELKGSNCSAHWIFHQQNFEQLSQAKWKFCCIFSLKTFRKEEKKITNKLKPKNKPTLNSKSPMRLWACRRFPLFLVHLVMLLGKEWTVKHKLTERSWSVRR